jgi:hypothetical protein
VCPETGAAEAGLRDKAPACAAAATSTTMSIASPSITATGSAGPATALEQARSKARAAWCDLAVFCTVKRWSERERGLSRARAEDETSNNAQREGHVHICDGRAFSTWADCDTTSASAPEALADTAAIPIKTQAASSLEKGAAADEVELSIDKRCLEMVDREARGLLGGLQESAPDQDLEESAVALAERYAFDSLRSISVAHLHRILTARHLQVRCFERERRS